MKASVIIPTKNGGALFKQVLERVLAQDTPWPFEVLIIDSGSRDGTLAYSQSLAGVRCVSIPAEEFGHGKTRNFGISLSRGEFAVLITQDALPADAHWLANLVAANDTSAEVAGAFGRHLAYPGNPFLERDLRLHFEGFREHLVVRRSDDEQRYQGDEGYRQMLHFFSNNNACIRRSVWERYPYPEVDFAEDQIWAQGIIEANLAKAYAHDAAVYHSHDFPPLEQGRRSFDEARALRRLFGYRLCPSLAYLVGQTLATTHADWAYLRSIQGDWRYRSHWRWRGLLRNGMKQLGHYLGDRSERLPNWLVRRISRDISIQHEAGHS